MAEYLEIYGGTPLRGAVKVSGAKNGALPLLIASLLSSEEVEYKNIPRLEDIGVLLQLLEHFGAEVSRVGTTAKIKVANLRATEASYSLVKALRASFWVLAPLLARGGAARVALPGGDIIGARPVDIHLEALSKMGADIVVKHGVVLASAPNGLKAAELDLRFPSVGATHQILMAASLTQGTTVIRGAAKEPEVAALAEMINKLGGEVEGAGSSTIVVRGREILGGGSIEILGDRIEAATYALATVATGGNVKISGFSPQHFGGFLDVLDKMGTGFAYDTDSITINMKGRPKPIHVTTAPFPEFATDIQAPLMAALAVGEGESSITENMFEGRFAHVSELCRMGAQIQVHDRKAVITGVSQLTGAPVDSFDIRAAAAVVIGGLTANGVSQVSEPQHLRRGYDSLVEKLTGLGARLSLRIADPDDYVLTGC